MSTSFITGINGFAGSFLARHLLEEGKRVSGLVKPGSSLKSLVDIQDRLQLREADIRDTQSIQKVIEELKPSRVYHLAAFSNPAASTENFRLTLETNIFGQQNILSALRDCRCSTKILVVGSALEYSLENADLPLTEESALAPVNTYELSKIAQDLMGYQFYRQHELPVVRVRPFNHSGPGRPAAYVLSSFARQLAEIEASKQEPILRTGDLDLHRDFTDVRDVVRGYRLLIEKGRPGEVYNLCSGQDYLLRDLLDHLLDLTEVEVEVLSPAENDPELKSIFGDNKKIKSITGWTPSIPIEKTLEDLLNYWRHQINKN